MVQLAGKPIQGCIACYRCFTNRDNRCAVDKDIANECIAKMPEANGILLGSPTYFSDVTAGMRALIERTGFVGRANNYMLKYKVGAGVIAVRRAGAIPASTRSTLSDVYADVHAKGQPSANRYRQRAG